MAAKKAGLKAHIGAEVTTDFSPRRHGDTETAKSVLPLISQMSADNSNATELLR
jgi:hypothetical protein